MNDEDVSFCSISSEASNRKKLGVVSSGSNSAARDAAKTPTKVRRDEKHLCPYW